MNIRQQSSGSVIGRASVLRRTVWALLAYGVVSGAVVVALLLMMRDNAIVAGERLAGAFAQLTEQQTSPVIASAKMGLEDAAARISAATSTVAITEGAMRQALRGILKDRQYFREIRVLDAQGRIVYDSEPGTIGRDLSDRPHFIRHRDRPDFGFEVGALFESPSTGTSYIPATLTLRRANGEFSGVIIGAIAPRYLKTAWTLDGQVPGLAIVLASEGGKLLMRVPSEARFNTTLYGDGPLVARLQAGHDFGTLRILRASDEEPRLLAFRRLAGFPGLVIVVGHPTAGVLTAWRHSVWMTGLGWALGLASLAGLALWLARAWTAKQAAEQQLGRLFDASPYPLYVTDRESQRIVAVSDEAVTVFGWSREEFLTKSVDDLYLPEDVPAAVARRKLYATEVNQVYRGLRHRKKDGTVFSSELAVRVIEYNGRPATLGMVMDVTGRLRTERARQAAEDRNRALFESSPHPIYAVNRRSERIVAVNDAAVALYGWSREEFLAMTSSDFYLPEDLPGVIAQRKLTQADSTLTIRGRRHRKKDGTVIDVELNGREIDLDDQPTLLANVEDVTAKNQAEARRLEAEKRLRAVMDSTVDGLITIDQAGHILSLNKTAEAMFGYREAEVGGRNVRILMPESFRLRHDGGLASYIETGDARIIGRSTEVVGTRKDGAEFPMELAVNEIPDGSGRRRFVGTVRDITTKKAIADQLRQTQERYRALFEASPYPVCLSDRETLRILAVSDEAVRQQGWSREEFLAMTVNDLYAPEDLPAIAVRRREFTTSETQVIKGFRHRRKDGTVFDVEIAVRLVDYDGRPAHLTMITDVTERLRAERARLAAEEQLRRLFEESPYPLYVTDRESLRIVAVSDEAVRTSGWSREELLKMYGNEVYPPEDLPLVLARRKVFTAHETKLFEGVRQLRKDRTVIDVDMAVRVIDYNGRPATLVMMIDVTERLRAQQARLAAEERNRLLFEASPYPIYLSDRESLRILAVSDEAVRLQGWSRDEFLAMTAPDLYPPEDQPKVALLRKDLTTGRTQILQGLRYRHKDGTLVDVEIAARLIDHRGQLACIAMAIDVTDRLRAEDARQATEEQLRQSQAHYRLLFDSNPYATTVADRGTRRVVGANPVAERLYGWTQAEMLAMTVDDFYLPEDAPAIRARRQTFLPDTSYHIAGQRHRTKGGKIIDVEMAARIIEYDGRPANLTIITDVTERLRAEKVRVATEAQLRQSQKMEVVGQLTGGVAHDFNNILTVILANADALQDEEGLAPAVVERLDRIAKAVGRASDLTRSLLTFSRKHPLSPKATVLNDLVSATAKLLRHTLGEHIEFGTVLAADLWVTEVDRAQLEAALVNLCVNARDAMPEGGRLTIKTANVVLDEDHAARHPGSAAGGHVSLSVTDTGSGMPPEVVARVFEPFFTTKGVGKGTGLGLSMVHGFVTQSGGSIRIESEVGRGTSFELLLPRSKEAEAASDIASDARATRGTERILVVEDEPDVRASVVGVLTSLGYAVASAPDGAAGLAVFESASLPFDMLLTDVVMPGPLNGKALADEVVRRWPETRIAFMSGYTDNALSQGGRLDDGVMLLTKPFRRADLAKFIRQALDGAAVPGRVPALFA